MDLLEMLMGSSQAKAGFEDFLNRFEEGPPSEGYDDQEVLDRYGQVAHQASPSDYAQAARDAFGRLSQSDREELGQLLAGQARSRRLDLPGLTPTQGQGFGDLDWLTNMTSQIHQQPVYCATFWVASLEAGGRAVPGASSAVPLRRPLWPELLPCS